MCPRLTSWRPPAAGRAGRFALVLVFAFSSSGGAQQSLRLSFYPANEIVLQNYSPEFPPIGALYALMRSQVMADHTARLLRDAPAAPETFEMLVYMERREQAVEVLRRIIQSAPAQMDRLFELLLSRNLFPSTGDGGDNPLPQLIADARSRLGRLPRADAGRVDRVLVLLETRGGRVPAQPTRSAALRTFIARYSGTDAAADAEVDLITLSSNNPATWIAPLDEIVRQHPGTTTAARALFEGRPAVFPRELMDFITAYLPAEQEMIGRLFTFASVPNVLSVTFIDEARTRAEVGIRTWSSGGTLRVEKQEGAWHVTGVAGAYVN